MNLKNLALVSDSLSVCAHSSPRCSIEPSRFFIFQLSHQLSVYLSILKIVIRWLFDSFFMNEEKKVGMRGASSRDVLLIKQ